MLDARGTTSDAAWYNAIGREVQSGHSSREPENEHPSGDDGDSLHFFGGGRRPISDAARICRARRLGIARRRHDSVFPGIASSGIRSYKKRRPQVLSQFRHLPKPLWRCGPPIDLAKIGFSPNRVSTHSPRFI